MNTRWTISTLERNTDNGVVTAFWMASKIDDGYQGSVCNTCSFTPDSTSSDYIDYADLTEQQVVSWVKNTLGQDKVLEIEADIDKQIEDMKEPLSVGVPW